MMKLLMNCTMRRRLRVDSQPGKMMLMMRRGTLLPMNNCVAPLLLNTDMPASNQDMILTVIITNIIIIIIIIIINMINYN